MKDYQRYLKKLFNPGELICATDSLYGTQLVAVEQALDEDPTNYVSINPLRGHRLDANVTEHRNLLIEFDKQTIDEQMAELVAKKVPYTSLVFSGSKSLHVVIALDEPITKEEYSETFKLIRYVLWQSDPTARNPSRLTRCAGATRNDNGNLQELVDLKRRVTRDQLHKWLGKFEGHIQRCIERDRLAIAAADGRRRERSTRALCAEGIEIVDPQTLEFLKGYRTTSGSRHARLVAACFELFECGVDYEEALLLCEQAADVHGITADPKRLREAQSIVNYVYGGK